MRQYVPAAFAVFLRPLKETSWWLGLALAGTVAAAAMALAKSTWAQHLGLSALTLAIVCGIVAGNTVFPVVATHVSTGVDFSKNMLLRAGIVLYGFRITFQQIADVGWAGVTTAVMMVTSTFLLSVLVGTRILKLDRQTAMLIGAGSAICGAAAVMAVEPVVRGQAHKVSVAVATVMVFGTLAMFAYPWLYPHLGLSEHEFGMFAGSTIHEVAQVVAAARSVGDAAAATAVIEKMIRVMLLAPFLLFLSIASRGANEADAGGARITIPWFAVLFIAASAANSLNVLPVRLIDALIEVDTMLLSVAMAALGLRTHVGAIRQAGVRPLLLAAVLFVFLIGGGYGINRTVTRLLT